MMQPNGETQISGNGGVQNLFQPQTKEQSSPKALRALRDVEI